MCYATFTLTTDLQSTEKKTIEWLDPDLTAKQLVTPPERDPPYHCCQKAIACFFRAVSAGGPVSPELVMQPLTPDGSLSEGFCAPTAGAPGCFGRGPRLDALARLDRRGAKEAFGRQDWQRRANAGHKGQGQGKPSTYCQILN